MRSEVAKVMFIIDGVLERKTSRYLESVLNPKLEFPCFVQVVADHVMAFELAMLQDFHAIVLPQKSADKRFSTDAFSEIVKTIRGFSASLIYTVDAEKEFFSSHRGRSIVSTNGKGDFNFEELVHAIAFIVDEPPSAEVLDPRMVSADPAEEAVPSEAAIPLVQAVPVPKTTATATRVTATTTSASSPKAKLDGAAKRRKRPRRDAEATGAAEHSQQMLQGQAAAQAAQAHQQYWESWQQHFYQQQQDLHHHHTQPHAQTYRSHPIHPSAVPSTTSTSTSISHPSFSYPTSSAFAPALAYPYPYPYPQLQEYAHCGPDHRYGGQHGQGEHPAYQHMYYSHAPCNVQAHAQARPCYPQHAPLPQLLRQHHRSDSTTEEACSISADSTEEDEEMMLLHMHARHSTASTSSAESGSSSEHAAELDLEGFDDMLFCMSHSPVPF